MQMWVCDRCNQPIQQGNEVFTIESRYRREDEEVYQRKWDVCGSCLARIQAEIERPAFRE